MECETVVELFYFPSYPDLCSLYVGKIAWHSASAQLS